MQLKRICIALLLFVGILVPQASKAQETTQPLPIDTAVRMGVLPNGLTYIVRKNSEPKGRANFYIAQKVGSILEDENQLGLAHFLEHMAFNGTKNFPGKNLISFLERIGCRFGADLNAYTAFDETVYTIMDAPTNQGKEIIDSCVLILHDWSNNITLDNKEIDEERGVIEEEWRSRNNAQMRIFTEEVKKGLPGNKYADRMPIGTMEIVLNFPYKAIKDFYHKWYRPDLQGIIVVGDLDPDYVVEKIKGYFADVPAPVNPAKRYQVPVEDNEKPFGIVVTDKEATSTTLSVMYKHEPLDLETRGSIVGLMFNYFDAISTRIINERLEAISKKPNAPFIGAGSYDSDFMGITKTKKALSFAAVTKDGGAKEALETLAREIHRIDQYGFLTSEYDRARRAVLKAYQDSYNERGKRSNSAFTEEYKEYFLNGGYIPGIEMEKMIMEQVAANVTAEQVTQYIKEYITDGKNLVISVTGPEKDGIKYPTEAQLVTDFLAAYKQPVEALKEDVSDENLIDKELSGGKIISEKKAQKFGATELILDNGIKVYLKPTDFKDDAINMRGITNGGTELYKTDEDILNAKILNDVTSIGGLGKFDEIALDKALTGRTARASLSVDDYTTSVSGHSTKEDFETLMQLTYLTFTDLRHDAEAYEAYKQKSIDMLRMQERDPLASLGDSVTMLLYDYDLKHRPIKEADFEKISYDRALQMAKERVASADGFEFFFVGNIDVEAVKPVIAKYLGSLPKGKATPKMDRTKAKQARKGVKTLAYKKESDTPMAITIDLLRAPSEYSLKNTLTAEILNGVLDQVLIASIRERESGTYSPQAMVQLEEFPVSEMGLVIQFFSNPDKAAHLNKVVYDELNLLVKNGISQTHFDKTITNMKKVYDENQRSNSYWLNELVNFNFFDRNFYDGYQETLKSITTKDVQKSVDNIMKAGNRLELLFEGQPKAKK